MKIALGTAQFGLDYGISNKRGKIPDNEIERILQFAYENNITTLDTAQAYGDSEEIIGKNIINKKYNFDIVTKLHPDFNSDEDKYFNLSFERLNRNKLFGLLFHSFDSFIKNPLSFEKILRLKENGKIKKIGFSLYFPHELEYLIKNNFKIDIVQIPYNIFDRRFERYFKNLKEIGVQIHARSIFLQGLVFFPVNKLNNNLVLIKDKLEKLKSISVEYNITISSICLNFVAINKYIDKIITGIDRLDNLVEIISSLEESNRLIHIYQKLLELKEDNEKVILPFNW